MNLAAESFERTPMCVVSREFDCNSILSYCKGFSPKVWLAVNICHLQFGQCMDKVGLL
jgi:hypothetical protein